MSLMSRFMSRLMHLPPAQTYDVVVTRNIQIPMSDGVTLLAEHYAPRGGEKLPTLLVRSPYGRGGLFRAMLVTPYAERGYQVLIQSCRGTAGSGGEFLFARNEHADGLATIAWIKQQEWFSGELATIGPSYLGFVQWSLAADAGPELKAIVPQITTSDFNHHRFQGGSFNLETSLSWSTMMTAQAAAGMKFSAIFSSALRNRKLKRAYDHLPLGEADQLVVQQSSQLFQEQIQYGSEDDYWQPIDFSTRLAEVNVPAYLMSGWYDMFLYWQLKDYQTLRKAGKQPYLLVGPWIHTEFGGEGMTVRETLAWLDTHVKGQHDRLHVTAMILLIRLRQ